MGFCLGPGGRGRGYLLRPRTVVTIQNPKETRRPNHSVDNMMVIDAKDKSLKDDVKRGVYVLMMAGLLFTTLKRGLFRHRYLQYQ